MHLIADLDNLHRQLLTLPAGENYRRLYGAVAPELPGLKSKLGKPACRMSNCSSARFMP